MINIILTLIGIASMLLGIYIFRKHWKESRVFVVLFSLAFFLLGSTFILLQFYYVFPDWMGDKSVFRQTSKVTFCPRGAWRDGSIYSLSGDFSARFTTKITYPAQKDGLLGDAIGVFVWEIEDLPKFLASYTRLYPEKHVLRKDECISTIVMPSCDVVVSYWIQEELAKTSRPGQNTDPLKMLWQIDGVRVVDKRIFFVGKNPSSETE